MSKNTHGCNKTNALMVRGVDTRNKTRNKNIFSDIYACKFLILRNTYYCNSML